MSHYDTNKEENSKRFYKLADKLDVLLKHFANNSYIINNSNVHLPRNHPEYLHIWKPVIYKKFPKISDFIKITFFLLRSIPIYGLILFRELFQKNNKNFILITDKNIDYLFISHHLETNNKESDFYYGDLIKELTIAGKSIIRLLIPHTTAETMKPKKVIYQTILLNQSISKLLIFKYIINNCLAISRLLFFCQKNKFTYYETTCILIGQIKNFYNFKLTCNIESFLNQATIKNLIMTFEGNALERSIFYLCHKHKVKSFGYQHAPIIKDQNSIFRSFTPELNPDIILASGPYTVSNFKEKLGPSCKVKLIGSPKFAERKGSLVDALKKKNGQILLVPDGNAESIIKFCEMGHDLSKKDSNLCLKIRAHPLFVESLNERMALINKNNNFSTSSSTLINDLENSSWVIYENSSVAIEAIFYYCKLIYFENPLADVDPLFDLHHNKYTAGHLDEIYYLLQNNSKSSDFEENLAYSFGQDYFHVTDYKEIFND